MVGTAMARSTVEAKTMRARWKSRACCPSKYYDDFYYDGKKQVEQAEALREQRKCDVVYGARHDDDGMKRMMMIKKYADQAAIPPM
jgi:hypothetical protein